MNYILKQPTFSTLTLIWSELLAILLGYLAAVLKIPVPQLVGLILHDLCLQCVSLLVSFDNQPQQKLSSGYIPKMKVLKLALRTVAILLPILPEEVWLIT